MTAGVALRVLCLISSYVTYVPSFPCRENVFAQMHPNADSETGNRRMEKKNCAKVSLRFQCLVVSCLQGILLALLVDNTEGMEWAFSMKK